MKIAVLGTGTWGFCLASLLAAKGFSVTSWTQKKELVTRLEQGGDHPHLSGHTLLPGMRITLSLEEALNDAEMIVESVTSSGIRPVFGKLKNLNIKNLPIVFTSKGIEQGSGLILPDVAIEVLGEKLRRKIAIISGPSFASEVIKGLPTSVVGSAYEDSLMQVVCETFNTPSFRVYPNRDVHGVAFGGALKNIVAIACGVSDGLRLGQSSKAALMTRGLHEIKKLAVAYGCRGETLYGLSGMGDVCLTCSSTLSRNYSFGRLLAEGFRPEEAEEKIDMVVEGAYTCLSALELSKKLDITMPIAETIYMIVYEKMAPKEAVKHLMQRKIKEEHL